MPLPPPNTFFPRQTNTGWPLTSEFLGGESDTIREIPPEFRAALDLTVIEIPLPWDVLPVPLSDTVLASKAEQKVTSERMRRTTYKPPGQVPLVEHYTDKYKQFGIRTRTFKTEGDSVLMPNVTRDVNTKNLGNYHFIEDDEDSLTLFTEELWKVSIPDALPKEFAVLLPITEHSYVLPEVVSMPVLGTGELEHESQQVNVFVGRETSRYRGTESLPASLVSYKMTRDKQIETITTTLNVGLQSLTGLINELTIEAEVENLGNNTSLLRIGTVPTLFQAYVASTEIPDLVPEVFRASLPTHIEEYNIAGTVVDPPILAIGDFERKESQLDVYTKRVMTRGRAGITLPVIALISSEVIEEFGGGIINTFGELDSTLLTVDTGLRYLKSKVTNLGNGLYFKETGILSTTTWPVLASRLWDENMRLEYDQTEQIVAAGTSEDPNPGGVFGWSSEVKAVDAWRSRKINTSKPAPIYIDSASALVSYEYKPYRFPGLIYFSGTGYYVRHADAALTQFRIKTWWLSSTTTPTVGPTGSGADVEIDDIIMDDVVINDLSLKGLTYSGPALHDALAIGLLSYSPTTPSYTQYALGTPTGTSTLHNYAFLYVGGTGFTVGDTLTISSGGYSMTVTVTFVDSTGVIQFWTNGSGTFPVGSYGPFLATGGSGTGAYFTVTALEVPNYTPGSQWIGTYRVVGATVKPEKEVNVWKVVTEEVVMR